jgi:CheY-like chemotaxis protein
MPKSLFFIDDDESFLLLIEKLTRKIDAVLEVRTALNGEEALTKIKEWVKDDSNLPNLMFVDINMPKMNGFEFLEEFKNLSDQIFELKKIVPIVMLTSSERESDKQKATDLGIVDHFYHKSHDINELKESIQKLIE